MLPAILAIDQGTTRTKALIFDAQAHCLAECSSEIPLTSPHPGWVDQDPRDL
ncbi:MAG: glycerol kinase, partial [Chloroflexi bacterium]